jgi:hypothetical protein
MSPFFSEKETENHGGEAVMGEHPPQSTMTHIYRVISTDGDFIQLGGPFEPLHLYPISEDESNVAQRSPTFGEDAGFMNKDCEDAKLVAPSLKELEAYILMKTPE